MDAGAGAAFEQGGGFAGGLVADRRGGVDAGGVEGLALGRGDRLDQEGTGAAAFVAEGGEAGGELERGGGGAAGTSWGAIARRFGKPTSGRAPHRHPPRHGLRSAVGKGAAAVA